MVQPMANDGCVELLLKAGADVNFKIQDDMTALALATSNGHAECARLLQEAGASVNSDQFVFSDDDNEEEMSKKEMRRKHSIKKLKTAWKKIKKRCLGGMKKMKLQRTKTLTLRLH